MTSSVKKSKVDQIKSIHEEFMIELQKLQMEQEEIASKFIHELEQMKLAELRRQISSDKLM